MSLFQKMDFPAAILLARFEDVKQNNNVLYRLVRPTETGVQLESVDKMVNVVPFKRTYRFDRKDELQDFSFELLRRPLVLQPVVHFGRGIGKGSLACGMCYKDDKWVMLINQTHPKILSRLQIGLDAAKSALARGQSFEVRFEFSKLVQKTYRSSLTHREQEAAANKLDLVKSYFRFAEWEHGDLIVRHHGYAAMFGRGGGMKDLSTLYLSFDFEDLLASEITWKTSGAEYFPKPHLAPVTEDEIRECLPAWTVNGVSPLENIGDQIPKENYSYAQAGRLYESFRKKKRQPRADAGSIANKEITSPAGTVSRSKAPDQDNIYNMIRDDGYTDLSFRNYQTEDFEYDEIDYRKRKENETGVNKNFQEDDHYSGRSKQRGESGHAKNSDYYNDQQSELLSRGHHSQQQKSLGPMYPEVQIKTVPQGKTRKGENYSPSYANVPNPATTQSTSNHTIPNSGPISHAPSTQFSRLRMQGSDRSSHSEAGSTGNTDSGIHSDSEGQAQDSSFDKSSYLKTRKGSPQRHFAMDNMAFEAEEDEVSLAMRKHKEMVAKMLAGNSQPNTMDIKTAQQGFNSTRQQGHTSHSMDRAGHYLNSQTRLPSSSNGININMKHMEDISYMAKEYVSSPTYKTRSHGSGIVEESFI